MEEIELIDIADDLLIVNKTTIDRLFALEKQNELVLYLFYYKTAKWQKHNPIKANDEYCKRCLHWGTNKLKETKQKLKEMELIAIEKRFDDKHRLEGWYVRVNYLIENSTIPKTTIPNRPLVEKQEVNTNNNNTINTNNNKNTKKEIYKEICIKVITRLNELNNTKYSTTSEANLKFIKGRLDDGYTEEDLLLVVDKMSYLWNQPSEKDMRQYLRPSTLFRPTNFENYLNMPVQEKKQTTKDIKIDDFTDFIKKGMR